MGRQPWIVFRGLLKTADARLAERLGAGRSLTSLSASRCSTACSRSVDGSADAPVRASRARAAPTSTDDADAPDDRPLAFDGY